MEAAPENPLHKGLPCLQESWYMVSTPASRWVVGMTEVCCTLALSFFPGPDTEGRSKS